MDNQTLSKIQKLIEVDGQLIVDEFYDSLLHASPDLAHIFRNSDLTEQKKRLKDGLESILALQTNPQELSHYLEDLGIRHIAYEVDAVHYPLVKEALVKALENHAKIENISWPHFVDSIIEPMKHGAQNVKKVANYG